MRAAHLHPSYELVDWKRVGQNKLVALVRSALVRVRLNDGTSSDSNTTTDGALTFDTNESQKALGSTDTQGSGSNSQDFASYILIFKAAPRATWVFERKIKLALPYVKNESGAGDSTTTNSGSLYKTLQDLLVEQPVTPYTPNAGLARVNGVAQDKVHGLESGWDNQRSQKNLTNNPGPKAVTGFKLDKGRAYRKLNEAWPVYEPLDSTKEGKGKDESSWKNSEKTTAENDAPLVGSTGSQMASSTSLGNVGDTTALTPLLRGATTTTTVQLKQTDSNSQDQQKFQKYLNTAQALHQMGVIVPELSQGGWQSQTARHSSTRGLQSAGANRGASLAARTTTTVGVGRRDSTSTTLELPNVITQLYHTSTSQLAYLNGQIVVMGSNAVPSLWYWVVDERTTSGRATWWAKTHLNFGTEVQKNFVENQLGFKSEDNSNTSLTNFKSQGLTQPAYLISGLDVVADHLVFAAFKAGAVGYDMTTDSNASTYNQALTWSTTAGLDSDGGYNNLVTNTAGLNGPINGLFTLLDTFAYVTPVSGMKGGSKNNEEVQTTYPVKSDQKATAKIASLINASPLNSYGDNGDKKAIHLRWKADSSKIFLTIGKLTKAVSLM
ncbi:hypothetical protein MPTA7396_1110 [Mycoplasmoides pneumoniae]|uniref:MgpC protein n=8 Tax=Mycoplasmoides pneumoniae TaxID=2104 RepID=A0AB38W835_MYCPM|nr:hypothetical protein KPI25BX_6500 [Mycoplasmoides pneumoniae]VEU57402.1 MgpC protein precursor [Mycoplasmoides pneumoniae]